MYLVRRHANVNVNRSEPASENLRIDMSSRTRKLVPVVFQNTVFGTPTLITTNS